jgi:adenine-specific DNA-methyltransferase
MSFNSRLTEVLKKDSRFVDDDGELVIAAVLDQAWKIDHDLVKLLFSDKEIKAKFFDEIAGHWVFNLNTFIAFVSQKNFLDNSYTRFRNRIGLTIGGKHLRERGDVALVWPYKDCVLEGGQTKEEEKRKEIFFNEVLAEDEISRLLSPKVLTGFVRYTAKGKQPVKEFRRDKDGVIRENLIINGNNLLALYTLKTLFRGQVKIIYIDPPYNTGSDSFGYNDSFNHSTWLTFMKNRLEVAKEFLRSDGIIFVQCDDNEQAYLKILMDGIFPGRFMVTVAVKMSEATGVKMAHVDKRLPKYKEYIHVYANEDFRICDQDLIPRDGWNEEYKVFLKNFSKDQRRALQELQAKEEADENDVVAANKLLKHVKMCSLSAVMNDEGIKEDAALSWKFENAWRIVEAVGAGSIKNVVMKQKGIPDQDMAATLSADKVLCLFKTAFDRESRDPRIRILFAEDHLAENPGDFWKDIKTTGGFSDEGGVYLPGGKKPERLLRRVVLLGSKPGDIVLDYHLGVGTTCAVAHKMNRQYIGIEQLDYGKNSGTVRLQNVIKGEQTGISEVEKWQGGGEFIACELMKYNEAFMERIEAAKTSKELVKIWKDMAEGSFLNWYINPKVPDDALKEFEAIGKDDDGVKKQRWLLAELLDKNQLYVNLSEIDDAQFKVSAEDKALNKAFYGEAYNA